MVPEWEEIAAVSMAVQNMYLTCTANNIGCYWSSPKIVDHLNDSIEGITVAEIVINEDAQINEETSIVKETQDGEDIGEVFYSFAGAD